MARLRIQFATVGIGRGSLGGQIDDDEGLVVAATMLDVGPAATVAGSQPAVPSGAGGDVFARLTAVGAAIYVAVGLAPDPMAEPRFLVIPGLTIRIYVTAGQKLSAILATDLPANLQAPLALVSAASPVGAAGSLDALSLNTHGALRVLAQNPDGTDVDTTAATPTTPVRSGTITVAQATIGSAAPVAPALAANPVRKHACLSYKSGGPAVYWGPAASVTPGDGFFVPPGLRFDLPPGYTGDVYLIADAAGPTAVSVSQLA